MSRFRHVNVCRLNNPASLELGLENSFSIIFIANWRFLILENENYDVILIKV